MGDLRVDLDGQQCVVPAWARWLAQDADGTWWAYEVESLQHDSGWYENEVGRSRRLCRGQPNPEWRLVLVPSRAVCASRAAC